MAHQNIWQLRSNLCDFGWEMAKAAIRRGRRQAGRRKPRVPRNLSGAVTVRRAYSNGVLAVPAVDSGIQVGVVPSNTLDWSSFANVYRRFKVLKATVHFVIAGDFDATPASSTFVAYHDPTNLGAPTSFQEALVARGRKLLPVNQAKNMASFTFAPMLFTSSAFTVTLGGRSAYAPTTSGFIPSYSSLAVWCHNYRTTLSPPPVQIMVELVLHFDSPI